MAKYSRENKFSQIYLPIGLGDKVVVVEATTTDYKGNTSKSVVTSATDGKRLFPNDIHCLRVMGDVLVPCDVSVTSLKDRFVTAVAWEGVEGLANSPLNVESAENKRFLAQLTNDSMGQSFEVFATAYGELAKTKDLMWSMLAIKRADANFSVKNGVVHAFGLTIDQKDIDAYFQAKIYPPKDEGAE
jgi:hypothetical protein